MNRFDRLLAKSPLSTDAPTCPWYEALVVFTSVGILTGLADPSRWGLAPALVCLLILIHETLRRHVVGISC